MLFTRMSMPPKAETLSAINCTADSALDTSAAVKRTSARGARAFSLAHASVPAADLRPLSMMRGTPASASCAAISKAMPPEDPLSPAVQSLRGRTFIHGLLRSRRARRLRRLRRRRSEQRLDFHELAEGYIAPLSAIARLFI